MERPISRSISCVFILAILLSITNAYGNDRIEERRVPTNFYDQRVWITAEQVSYSEAKKLIADSPFMVETVVVLSSDGVITNVLIEDREGNRIVTTVPGKDAGDHVVNLVEEKNINLVSVLASNIRKPRSLSDVLMMGGWGPTVLSLIVIIGFILWMNKRKKGPSAGPKNGMTKSGAKQFVPSEDRKTFNDVAGADEAKAELQEFVEFLKDKSGVLDMLGGKKPRGVLLIGPPGNGKTLLAKAVAGEAGADFFHISGSDFVQMYVGVGAARVRDLFKTASISTGSIIFIDEIDAVGRQRGTGIGGGNDEREQTLNQLLKEMDGFESRSNVVVLAATNRPDVLDPALLRPGRFDRQILVDRPDFQGRKEILAIHAANKPLAEEVDLSLIAHNTVGFSGAQLEGSLNESSIIALRRVTAQRSALLDEGMPEEEIVEKVPLEIRLSDIDEGMDRIMFGPSRENRASRMSEKDMRNTAVHESGHAWIADQVYKAGITSDPVTKITIIPRARALGYMIAQPEADSYGRTKEYCLARIMVAMGGRCAQEIILNTVDSGASNDFEQAWGIAHEMVTKYGMSRLGLISVGENSNPFLGKQMAMQSDASGELNNMIEAEVRRILDECYKEAYRVIERDRELIEPIIEVLLEKETILKDEWISLTDSIK